MGSSSTTAGKFACDACGKSYTWKAELAGKRVKCKCGAVMTVPASDPAAAVAAEDALPPDFEDLYALAQGEVVAEAVTPPAFTRGGGSKCPSCGTSVESAAVLCVGCGMNLKTGKKIKTQKAGGGGAAVPAMAGAAGGGKRSSAMLGYAQMAPKRHGGDEERSGDVFFHPVKDLYIPGALVVAGTVMSYLALVFHHDVKPGVALFAVGVMTLINLILTVPAVLATVKMFDLGLGPIGPGVLKIAACAILPGAIGELMGMIFTGAAGGYIGWCISYLATLGIFMKLLDMDFGEVLMCSSFIFVIRTWVVYALLFAMMNGMGIGGLPVGGGGFGGGGGGSGRLTLAGEVADEDDSLDAIRARESDDWTIRMLHGGGVDGKTWIEGGNDRVLAGQSHGTSLQVIKDFYSAGATEVRVFPRKDAKQGGERTLSIIVIPPDDKDTRARIYKQMKPLAKLLGRVTPRDRGEKYWLVELLSPDQKEKELDSEFSLPGKAVAPDDGDDDK
jgi:hypothetical protein